MAYPKLDETTQCFYDARCIIDVCYTDELGVLRSQINQETLDAIRARYPGAQVGLLDAAAQAIEDGYRSEPELITEDRWYEMLEVLPPMKWRSVDHTESFMISERLYGNITTIFCRIGSQRFAFNDSVALSHDDIVAHCLRSAPALSKTADA